MQEFDNWKVQQLVRDLFVLLGHAQWKDAEHAQSAESWIKSMEAKAVELGFTLDKGQAVLGSGDILKAPGGQQRGRKLDQ
jgi:hypothetical protein